MASMSQRQAVWQLSVANVNALLGRRFVALAVDGALAALVSGLDGHALRELAGLSRCSRDEDVRDLLDPALGETGVPVPMSVSDAQVICLRAMAIDVLFDRGSVRNLTSWAHAVIGHDGADAAQDIVELDDELDLVDFGHIPRIDARPIIESFLRASRPLVDRLTSIDAEPA